VAVVMAGTPSRGKGVVQMDKGIVALMGYEVKPFQANYLGLTDSPFGVRLGGCRKGGKRRCQSDPNPRASQPG